MPLLHITGPHAAEYSTEVEKLSRAEQPEGWTSVASSTHARVFYHSTLNVYHKEFLPRNNMESVKAVFRGSRCQRAREQGLLLSKAGFNSPACICWGTFDSGSEFMISEAGAGTGVTECIRQQLNLDKSPAGLRSKRRMLRELGELIGRLHQCGIVHGDLRPNNILTDPYAEPASFCFIDNERNSQHRNIPRKLILKNLVQLNMLLPSDITLSDRWRFFSSYTQSYKRFSEQAAKKLAVEAHKTAMGRLRKKNKL